MPTIAISAHRPIELSDVSKAAGIDGWMEIMFDMDEFEKMVKSYL